MSHREAALKIATLGIRGIPAHYGGFETCVDYTSRLLVRRGFDVTVYGRTQHFGEKAASYEGVYLRYVPRPNHAALHTIGHTMRCARDITKRIRRGERPFDVVHLYGVGNAFALPWLQRHGQRVVVSVDAQDWARDKWGPLARNYLLLAARFAVRRADAIVVDSRAIRDLYRHRFGARTVYIPYGAETEPARGVDWLQRLGVTSGSYHLFVGRLTPEKRPLTLVAAYRQVRSSMPLLIVGDDPYDKGYAKHLREVADERVRFVEPVYDEGFHQLCRHCYLFLTASAIEGTSPALLQAMGQGSAVLVNGIPANRETIGDAGFAYRSGDERDLVRLWQYLVDHPADVERVGRAAAARVAAHYRWEQVADALESLFQSLSSG